MFKNQLSKIRYSILESCHRIKEGHIGSAFSVVEILFVIFKKYFKKNYFILSKGHAAIGTYAVMNHFGILKNKDYQSFCGFNSKLGGHPDSTKLPNFNFSTGSLGHGLPVSTGLAFGLKMKKDKRKIICLMGDQEATEGTTWESLLVARSRKLNNLVCIIDFNKSGERALPLNNLKDLLRGFGIIVKEVNGHSIPDLYNAFTELSSTGPTMVIANTIKGYGLPVMENNPEWHHKFPSDDELNQMLKVFK